MSVEKRKVRGRIAVIHVDNYQIKINGRMLRISKLDSEMSHFVEDPEPIIQALRRCGRRVDLFTFLHRFSLADRRYSYPMEWDNLAVLPVISFDEWWNKQIGFKARNKARQAEKKGVVVREAAFDEELVRGIWEIYNEVPIRQGRPYPHYGKDLATVYNEEATYLNTSTFIGAFLGEELIGFIKLTADEANTQAGVINIVSKIEHRDKAPTNALLAQAVRSCGDRGISQLVYSNFAYGQRERDNLTDFKERNGFKRLDLPRYYVPLTPFGATAFRLGFHHRLLDRLPVRFGERLRELRGNWYNRSEYSERSMS